MIVLTDSEHAMFSALPYPGYEVDREHCCELQKRSRGLHYALGQASLTKAWLH
jgi:hypothetical protein